MMEQVGELPCAWQSQVYTPAQLTSSCVGERFKSLDYGLLLALQCVPSPRPQHPANAAASVTDQVKQISMWDPDWEKGQAKDQRVTVKDPRCQRNRQLKQVNQTSQEKITLENSRQSKQPKNSPVVTFKVS